MIGIVSSSVGNALQRLSIAGEEVARAVAQEMEFEDRRGPEKGAAIRRLMDARGMAATPAEKIVEEDAEYQAFCRNRRDSVINRIRSWTRYDCAKLEAKLHVALAAARVEEGN
jgi:hypothetical protein